MKVIGSSGHVDHGKTLLIHAMTGMDADRLPEEKARGMTTDMGFAWYEGPGGEPVGVVDVPGHERYLRNMVAGAWGIDLAVLVVAADDGWMPQTGLHASVLAALGTEALVIAVTKADLAEPARIDEVVLDSRERARAVFGYAPEAVAVSGMTGAGIPELKDAIARILSAIPPPVDDGRGYLWVDRCFTARGGASVVTGTLKGSALEPGDELEFGAGGERLKLRSLQTYGRESARAVPSCRVALGLTAPREGFERGDLLSKPGTPVLRGRDFLCRLENLPGASETCPRDSRGRPMLRMGVELELAVGSARRDAVFRPSRHGSWATLSCESALACPPGSRFALLRKGGAELVGRGTIVDSGAADAAGRKRLDSVLADASGCAAALEAALGPRPYAETDRYSLELHARGWAPAPAGLDAESVRAAGLEPARGRVPVAFPAKRWKALASALLKRASEPGSMNLAGAMAAAGLPREPVEAALSRLAGEGSLARSDSGWSLPRAAGGPGPQERAVLDRLKAAGRSGLEPGKSCPQPEARLLKTLCSLGEAVPLDGGIFFSRETYDGAVRAILAGRPAGGRFTVPEAKEASGLSRKYILPLLNRMESQGLVKRQGEVRVVLAPAPR